jgi:c-di-GMP-binding flagellar brake protein YcgR
VAVVNLLLLLPLQIDLSAFKKQQTGSPKDAIFFIIGIVAVVGILIIINKAKAKNPLLSADNATKGNGAKKAVTGSGQSISSFFAIHKIARNAGLDRNQTKMLSFVMKTDMVSDPERSVRNPALLDRHFKHAYKVIEQSASTDQEAQRRLAVLFSTRNILENTAIGGISNTRQLQDSTTMILHSGKEKYQSSIISAKGENITLERPSNNRGESLNLARGNKINVLALTKNNKGFSFESRVLGYSTSQGVPTMLLAHSVHLKMLSQRRYRRKQTVIACICFFVYVEGSGKKQRLVVDKKRLSGNIMDISVGGCSIKTTAAVNGGARLKIEFKQGDSSIAALGQVLRTNRTGINTIIHIKFLRASLRTMNTINTFVYDYAYE